METEKRLGLQPIPSQLGNYLTESQQKTLKKVRSYGLELSFIRRQRLKEPVVVLCMKHEKTYALLSPFGDVNFNVDIDIRDHVTVDRTLFLDEIKKQSQISH